MRLSRVVLDTLFRWWDRPNPNPNMGLPGDEDETDHLEDLERPFSIHFVDEEAEPSMTIGDLYLTILSKTQRSSDVDVWRAITRMAFEHRSMRPERIAPEMQLLNRIYD